MKSSTKQKISRSLKRHHADRRTRERIWLVSMAMVVTCAMFIGGYSIKAYQELEDMFSITYVREAQAHPNLKAYEVMEGNEYYVLMAEIAEEYDVSYDTMQKVVHCESRFIPDTQSFHYFDDGTRENSWGLSQIYLDVWTDITKEQANNPEFALRFMAEKFSEDKHHLWTCYRLLKDKGLV